MEAKNCILVEILLFSKSSGNYTLRLYQVSTLTCQIIMQQILLFFWEKNTYTTLSGPTRLLISEIVPSKHKIWLKTFCVEPQYIQMYQRGTYSQKSSSKKIECRYLWRRFQPWNWRFDGRLLWKAGASWYISYTGYLRAKCKK